MPFFERRNAKAVNGGAVSNNTGTNKGYHAPNSVVSLSSPMVEDIVADLQESGAFILDPLSPVVDSVSNVGWYVLEASGCDPLYAPRPGSPSGFEDNQNWFIAINSDNLTIAWGSERQIDSSLSNRPEVVQPGTPSVKMISDDELIGFSRIGNSYNLSKKPFQYKMVTTDRGFALAVYPQTKEEDAYFHRILCIQRPTNPRTGEVKVDGGAPVFVVYTGVIPYSADRDYWYDTAEIIHTSSSSSISNNEGVNGEHIKKPDNSFDTIGWYHGTVRDAFNPSSNEPEPMHKPNKNLLYSFNWNWMQPSHYDNLNTIIKFPTGMCIPGRYIYFDEMDIIGLTHAAAIPLEKEATIELYGGTEIRTYVGCLGHKSMMILIANGNTMPPMSGQATEVLYNSRVVFVKSGPSVL